MKRVFKFNYTKKEKPIHEKGFEIQLYKVHQPYKIWIEQRFSNPDH